MTAAELEELPEDSAIRGAVAPGDAFHRIVLPPWFEMRAPKGRKTTYSKRAGRHVPVMWRPVWEPLNLNWSGNGHVKGEAIATVRGWIVMECGPRRRALPKGEHLTVRLHYRPRNLGTRDGMNLAPLQKALIDGLGPQKYRTQTIGRGPTARKVKVPIPGLDLVPDDTKAWVTEGRPEILDPDPETPGLWLDVIVHRPVRPGE